MAKKNVKLEYYVLNEKSNSRGKIEKFNIFNNVTLYESTIKLCERYKKENMSLEDFTEELRSLIQWRLWSKVEYEIMVGSLFEDDTNKYQKIDCYEQVLPNINIVAQYVLHTYYPRLED